MIRTDAAWALLGLGAAYWAYALVAGFRTLAALVQVRREPPVAAGSSRARVSIVVAARDEAHTIAAVVDSFRELTWSDAELVLVNDRSVDGTGAIVDAAAAADPSRVRAVHVTELPDGWLGKVHALECGWRVATGEWLLFTDADVDLAPDVLERAMGLVGPEQLDHLALLPGVDAHGWLVAGAVATFSRWLLVAGRLWRAADPQPETGTPFGVGAFNLVRRASLERAGGFGWLRFDVADDAALAAHLVLHADARSMLASGAGVLRVHWQPSVRAMTRGFEKYGYTGGIGSFGPTLVLASTAAVGELAPLGALLLGLGTLASWLALGMFALLIGLSALTGHRAGAPWRGAATLPFSAGFVWWMQVRSAILERQRGGLVWRDTFYPTAELQAAKRFRLR